MYAYMRKVWEFLQKNAKNILIISGIILLCLLIGFLFGRNARENVPDNGESVGAIRSELDQAEGAKQDIANTASNIENTSTDITETVGNIASSIETATDTSSRFEQLIDECTNIIEQIRKQPAG